eukprot:Clim_evm48s142 gene=Clim_evmTU48s142
MAEGARTISFTEVRPGRTYRRLITITNESRSQELKNLRVLVANGTDRLLLRSPDQTISTANSSEPINVDPLRTVTFSVVLRELNDNDVALLKQLGPRHRDLLLIEDEEHKLQEAIYVNIAVADNLSSVSSASETAFGVKDRSGSTEFQAETNDEILINLSADHGTSIAGEGEGTEHDLTESNPMSSLEPTEPGRTGKPILGPGRQVPRLEIRSPLTASMAASKVASRSHVSSGSLQEKVAGKSVSLEPRPVPTLERTQGGSARIPQPTLLTSPPAFIPGIDKYAVDETNEDNRQTQEQIVNELTRTNRSLLNQNSLLEEQLSEVQGQLRSLIEEQTEEGRQHSINGRSLEETKAQLSRSRAEVRKLREDVDDLKIELQKMRSVEESLATQKEALIADNENLSLQVVRLRKQKADAELQISTLHETQRELERANTRIETLKKDNTEIGATASSTQLNLEDALSALKQRDAQVESLGHILNEARSAAAVNEQKIKNLKANYMMRLRSERAAVDKLGLELSHAQRRERELLMKQQIHELENAVPTVSNLRGPSGQERSTRPQRHVAVSVQQDAPEIPSFVVDDTSFRTPVSPSRGDQENATSTPIRRSTERRTEDSVVAEPVFPTHEEESNTESSHTQNSVRIMDLERQVASLEAQLQQARRDALLQVTEHNGEIRGIREHFEKTNQAMREAFSRQISSWQARHFDQSRIATAQKKQLDALGRSLQVTRNDLGHLRSQVSEANAQNSILFDTMETLSGCRTTEEREAVLLRSFQAVMISAKNLEDVVQKLGSPHDQGEAADIAETRVLPEESEGMSQAVQEYEREIKALREQLEAQETANLHTCIEKLDVALNADSHIAELKALEARCAALQSMVSKKDEDFDASLGEVHQRFAHDLNTIQVSIESVHNESAHNMGQAGQAAFKQIVTLVTSVRDSLMSGKPDSRNVQVLLSRALQCAHKGGAWSSRAQRRLSGAEEIIRQVCQTLASREQTVLRTTSQLRAAELELAWHRDQRPSLLFLRRGEANKVIDTMFAQRARDRDLMNEQQRTITAMQQQLRQMEDGKGHMETATKTLKSKFEAVSEDMLNRLEELAQEIARKWEREAAQSLTQETLQNLIEKDDENAGVIRADATLLALATSRVSEAILTTGNTYLKELVLDAKYLLKDWQTINRQTLPLRLDDTAASESLSHVINTDVLRASEAHERSVALEMQALDQEKELAAVRQELQGLQSLQEVVQIRTGDKEVITEHLSEFLNADIAAMTRERRELLHRVQQYEIAESEMKAALAENDRNQEAATTRISSLQTQLARATSSLALAEESRVEVEKKFEDIQADANRARLYQEKLEISERRARELDLLVVDLQEQLKNEKDDHYHLAQIAAQLEEANDPQLGMEPEAASESARLVQLQQELKQSRMREIHVNSQLQRVLEDLSDAKVSPEPGNKPGRLTDDKQICTIQTLESQIARLRAELANMRQWKVRAQEYQAQTRASMQEATRTAQRLREAERDYNSKLLQWQSLSEHVADVFAQQSTIEDQDHYDRIGRIIDEHNRGGVLLQELNVLPGAQASAHVPQMKENLAELESKVQDTFSKLTDIIPNGLYDQLTSCLSRAKWIGEREPGDLAQDDELTLFALANRTAMLKLYADTAKLCLTSLEKNRSLRHVQQENVSPNLKPGKARGKGKGRSGSMKRAGLVRVDRTLLIDLRATILVLLRLVYSQMAGAQSIPFDAAQKVIQEDLYSMQKLQQDATKQLMRRPPSLSTSTYSLFGNPAVAQHHDDTEVRSEPPAGGVQQSEAETEGSIREMVDCGVQVDYLSERENDLLRDIEERDQRLVQASRSIEELRNTATEAADQSEAFRRRLVAEKQGRENLVAQLSDARRLLKEAHDNNTVLDSELHKESERRRRAVQDSKTKEELIGHLRQKLASVEKQVNPLRDDVNALAKQNESFRVELERREKSMKDMRARLEVQSSRKTDEEAIIKDLENKSHRIQQLLLQVEQDEKEKKQLRLRVRDEQERVRKLQEEAENVGFYIAPPRQLLFMLRQFGNTIFDVAVQGMRERGDTTLSSEVTDEGLQLTMMSIAHDMLDMGSMDFATFMSSDEGTEHMQALAMQVPELASLYNVIQEVLAHALHPSGDSSLLDAFKDLNTVMRTALMPSA